MIKYKILPIVTPTKLLHQRMYIVQKTAFVSARVLS